MTEEAAVPVSRVHFVCNKCARVFLSKSISPRCPGCSSANVAYSPTNVRSKPRTLSTARITEPVYIVVEDRPVGVNGKWYPVALLHLGYFHSRKEAQKHVQRGTLQRVIPLKKGV